MGVGKTSNGRGILKYNRFAQRREFPRPFLMQ